MWKNVFRVTTLALTIALSGAKNPMLAQVRYRIEIIVERNEGKTWHEIDPRMILSRDDRVRFRVKSSFEGFLYVTYQSTAGNYDVLFPGQGTGLQNKVHAGEEYIVPQTASAFRITDPPGQEIVYFLLSPVELQARSETARNQTAGNKSKSPSTLVPRCDDSILRSHGDCIDITAGPKPVGDAATLPPDLARIPNLRSRELTLSLEQTMSVISSAETVSGPIVYEVRLSHR